MREKNRGDEKQGDRNFGVDCQRKQDALRQDPLRKKYAGVIDEQERRKQYFWGELQQDCEIDKRDKGSVW